MTDLVVDSGQEQLLLPYVEVVVVSKLQPSREWERLGLNWGVVAVVFNNVSRPFRIFPLILSGLLRMSILILSISLFQDNLSGFVEALVRIVEGDKISGDGAEWRRSRALLVILLGGII